MAWVIYTWAVPLSNRLSSKGPLVILNSCMRIALMNTPFRVNVPRESQRLYLVQRNQAPRRSRQHAAHHTTILRRLGIHFTRDEPWGENTGQASQSRTRKTEEQPHAQSLDAHCKISLNEEPQTMECSHRNALPKPSRSSQLTMERSEDQTKLRPNFVENFRGGRALGNHEKKLLSAERTCVSTLPTPR